MIKIDKRTIIIFILIYFYTTISQFIRAGSFTDQISPQTIFPTAGVQNEQWFGDVSVVISDVNDTLISPEAPVDKSGLIGVINELVDLGVVFCPVH